LPIRVINDRVWQNLFGRNLFIRPTNEEFKSYDISWEVVRH